MENSDILTHEGPTDDSEDFTKTHPVPCKGASEDGPVLEESFFPKVTKDSRESEVELDDIDRLNDVVDDMPYGESMYV